MSFVIPEGFQHIHRVLNTNIDGNRKVPFALTAIKGVGRRFSHICCRKAGVDITRRAGELSEEDLEKVTTVLLNPTQYKIPDWMLNRQRDLKDGKTSQVCKFWAKCVSLAALFQGHLDRPRVKAARRS